MRINISGNNSNYYEVVAFFWVIAIWVFYLNYDARDMFYSLALTSLTLNLLITVASYFPKLFNFSETPTAANRERLIAETRITLKVIKMIVSAVLLLTFVIIQRDIIFSEMIWLYLLICIIISSLIFPLIRQKHQAKSR